MYIWIILMLVGVFLDQISKYLIVLNFAEEESLAIIPKVFNFTYIKNTGAAFGMMSEESSRWIFMIISTVMIVGILVYIFWKKPTNKLLMSALTLIVAGGIGNMIDRIRLGYVVDFLDFCAFPQIWKWIFNVADSFVCIGAALMALWMILDMVKESKKERLARENAAAEGGEEQAQTADEENSAETQTADSEDDGSNE